MRSLSSTFRLSALVATALLAAPIAATTLAHAEITTPFISELHYDNASTDVDERVEITVPSGADITGWTVALYNGANGTVYNTTNVPVPNDQGVAVITYPANGIQNGAPDGVSLVDAGGVAVQFISYEGVVTATAGPANGQTSTDINVFESGSTPVGHSLQFVGGQWVGPKENTFGQLNDGGTGPTPTTTSTATATPTTTPTNTPTGDACQATPSHLIGQVQGSGDATSLNGTTVTVAGTVIGDLQEGGFAGFYMQDAGDGDDKTSDGIFVYDPDVTPAVDLGQRVVVSGQAAEFKGLTQLTNVTVTVCGAGDTVIPAALDLPATDAELESREGMLVAPVDELSVTEVYNLNRYGEVMLSEGGILKTPTEVAEPGDPAREVMAENKTRRVILDDGTTTNLSKEGINPPYLTVDDPIRVGDTVKVGDLEPVVLSYGFNEYRLQPADGVADTTVFTETNPRTPAPEEVGGNFTAGAFNVLNYFVTTPSEDGRSRGAENATEFAQQQAKIVTAIKAMDVDVLGLMEIENSCVMTPSTPYKAVQNLVDALNADGGSWDYVRACESSDVITNTIIYRTDKVTPVGDPRKPTEDAAWGNAREPIAQTFDIGGDNVTVIANHLKSKGSGSGAGNVDNGDGQGNSNADRVAQAQSLVAFADSVKQTTGDSDVLLLGDFNAYSKEDPIDVLEQAGYVNLSSRNAAEEYSYIFFGQSGSLDHALASPELAAKVTGFDIWNINADEAYAYQYNASDNLYAPYAYRASDHDPLVIGIAAATDPRSPHCYGKPATIVGTDGNDVLFGTHEADVIVAGAGSDIVFGLGGDDVVCGGDGKDWVFGGPGNDVVLGGADDDALYGGLGDDTLIGGGGQDALYGGLGNNIVMREGPDT